MKQPLPQRMYLLCWDGDKNRLDPASVLARGPLLRAAAVAELTLGGLLQDLDGKAGRTPQAARTPDDPFLAQVLDGVPPDRPRRWASVLDRDWHQAEAAVRDQLEAAGALAVERRRALGLFPVRRVTVTDPDRARTLRERVRNAVLGGHDPAGVAIEDTSLALFAANGDVHTVFTPRERRAHRKAFRAIADHVDTVLPGLRKGLIWSVAARRSAAAA